MLKVQRIDDPEMDHELYTLDCMLREKENNRKNESRRLIWMDGSDSDDEDQHSWSFIHKKIES